MQLIVSNSMQAKYPNLRTAVLVAEGVNNSYSESLEHFVRMAFSAFAAQHTDVEDIEQHKNILAWREVYRSFGSNPKKKKPTAESLLSRVVRSAFVPHINPVVDVYLASELLHFLPIGGYDLDRITGNIVLHESIGGEPFVGVGSTDIEPTDAGEVIYSDDARVLTRRWNYKDCDHAKIDTATTRLMLVVEGAVADISDQELKETAEDMGRNLSKYCGATTRVLFMEKGQTSLELSTD